MNCPVYYFTQIPFLNYEILVVVYPLNFIAFDKYLIFLADSIPYYTSLSAFPEVCMFCFRQIMLFKAYN